MGLLARILRLERSVRAPIMTEWENFTPTGSWSNTTYSGKKRRVGDSLEVRYLLELTGAPSGSLTLNIPDSLTIDTAKIDTAAAASTFSLMLGNCIMRENGVATYGTAPVYYESTTTVSPSSGDSGNKVTNSSPFSWNTNDHMSVHILVPILGWRVYR